MHCGRHRMTVIPTARTSVFSRLLCFTIVIVSLVLPEVIAETVDLCPPDFEALFGQCYFFSTYPSSWHEARQKCVTLDAALVSLETGKREDMALRDHIDEDESVGYWWTSGNKLNADDSWTWINDKEPMGYFNWCMDCPSDYNNNSCLLIGVNCWEDHRCNEKSSDKLPIHFICERTTLQNGTKPLLAEHEEL